jgi:hypothetical protein
MPNGGIKMKYTETASVARGIDLWQLSSMAQILQCKLTGMIAEYLQYISETTGDYHMAQFLGVYLFNR